MTAFSARQGMVLFLIGHPDQEINITLCVLRGFAVQE
jgi:hypothetical protein